MQSQIALPLGICGGRQERRSTRWQMDRGARGRTFEYGFKIRFNFFSGSGSYSVNPKVYVIF